MNFDEKKNISEISPYSGFTRKDWIEAGKYLLYGVFDNIKEISDTICVPRREFDITYPHINASPMQQESQKKAELFEAIARTFFVAAPLIKDNPEIEISGLSLKAYYKTHILRICTKDDCEFVGDFSFLRDLSGITDEYKSFQQTVEAGALVICLWICKNEIWDTYSKSEKDIIAGFLETYAHETTMTHNWRLFNMLIMAFLHMEGYSVNKSIMAEHTQVILNYHAGNGWYRDGQNFDYYSAWGFQLYIPLWNLWYGYDNEPDIAYQFEKRSNEFVNTFYNFFDEDGYTIMWGRSSIYRNASASAFVGNLFLKNPKVNYGLARRILSGSLLQFLSRDDFLDDGVPTLGFYKQFFPLVQGYSCSASPFWLAKPFIALYFDESHPIWSSKETNGVWDSLGSDEINETVLDGPALALTNHKSNGQTVLRSGKVLKQKSKMNTIWSYAKLNYNSKYPWEATPYGHNSIESQQYVLHDKITDEILYGNVIFWARQKEGVLYRRQCFGYDWNKLMHHTLTIDLADFPVKNGIMRADKIRPFRWNFDITLGSYGFPDNGVEIIHKTKGEAKAIILKGKDSRGKEKQMAMTVYDGWDIIDYVTSTGTNPDSEKSIVIYAKTSREKKYDGFSQYVLISQTITKESYEDFSDEEIFPIKSVKYSDNNQNGAYGDIEILFENSIIRKINFDEIEGRLTR